MTSDQTFAWLDGTVTLPAAKPAEWDVGGLRDFYHNPNDARWLREMSRVLIHESIHFWHLLSSGYLANLVQEEWHRLLQYEQSGNIPAASTSVVEATTGHPFSAMELAECWARYWDVHIRGAQQLLEDEGLDPAYAGPRPALGFGVPAYADVEFDAFMQTGSDAAVYGRPYRWALEQAGGDSLLLNAVFPALVFHAFATPQPVTVFTAALRLALSSIPVRRRMTSLPPLIGAPWFECYGVVVAEAVVPTITGLRLPSSTHGWHVLDRGLLHGHPIYSTYLARVHGLLRGVVLLNIEPPAQQAEPADALRFVGNRLARDEPAVMFAFPGHPPYRDLLGRWVPPPRIRFLNSEWCAERSFAATALAKVAAQAGLADDPRGLTLAAEYVDLDPRLAEFKVAEYSARVGLTASDFM